MIAMACAQQPSLMIADEPTTALDVTLQAQILNLLRGIVDETGMSLILISHDLAVVAEVTDDIVVMRNGEVLDGGPTGDVLRKLQHPYTAQLAEASTHVPQRNSAPILSVEQHANNIQPILKAHHIVRDYPTARTSIFKKGTPFRALNSVSFELFKGQSMGLVGESGCGKSTLARIVLGVAQASDVTLPSLTLAAIGAGCALWLLACFIKNGRVVALKNAGTSTQVILTHTNN
jgi:peptide/nickel transport system ATP-binding protein